MQIPKFNTPKSPVDSRNVLHEDLVQAGTPLLTGGIDYLPQDIEDQMVVGICTAISNEQLNRKKDGKKYSSDFFYLCEKIQDGNWIEGSSVLSSLKVANKIGFLPLEFWTYTTEMDRALPYSQYIKKLQNIPVAEIQRLKSLCVGKIAGYASVDVSDPQKLALAIANSKAGILCRVECGATWWTDKYGFRTFDPLKLNPLRYPTGTLTGHAVIFSKFDFNEMSKFYIPNTWGTSWNDKGVAYLDWKTYTPTEAWAILDEAPPIVPAFMFKNDLKLGMTSNDVKELQKILNRDPRTMVAIAGLGSNGLETSYFGALTLAAVKKFQAVNYLPVTGYVGILTRTILNNMLS